jgi:4-amino-4-deoxy-L-arabinose transferase-like glycosyltransferase
MLSVILSIGAIFFVRKNATLLKIALFLAGSFACYFACSLDMFIHTWDEQFHALVAKNMTNDFFHPVLVNNQLLAKSDHWTTTYTWLHKQPLFLWQMAVSLKVFGLNEIALRIPNIIAHGFLAVMLFDMGKLVKNEIVGLLSALVFIYLRFPLSYAGAMEATDHNDYMFLFYVTASFWALFKYHHSGALRYLILLGLLCGCAALVKWLTGFVAVGVWGIYCAIFERKKIKLPLIAFFTSLIVFLPWQIYCYYKYNHIYLLETSLNSKHFYQVIDGHQGSWYYHFIELKNLYANNNTVFLVIGISLFYFSLNKTISSFHKYVVLTTISLVYIFFSFAQTRMPAFCIVAIPFVVICISNTCVELIDRIENRNWRNIVYFLVAPQLIIFFFSPSYFIKKHSLSFRPNEQNLTAHLAEKKKVLDLKQNHSEKKTIFINANGSAIKIMFYTDFDAFDGSPDSITRAKLERNDFKIVDLNSTDFHDHSLSFFNSP